MRRRKRLRLRRKPKWSSTRKEYESEVNSIARKGSRRKFPLAGSRGGAPLWGLGQRPNCSAGDQYAKRAQQGAGSEASLPVTSRSLRSAPKLLFPTSVLCRAGWARPNSWSCDHSCPFPKAGDFAPAGASPTAKAVRIFAGRGCGRLFSYTIAILKNPVNNHQQ